jgi:hypothetical protein
MMNRTHKISATTLAAAAMVLAFSACQRSVEPSAVSNGQPSQTVIHPGPTAQGTIRDPSVPDATTVFAAEEAAAKARADAEALQQTATQAQSSLAAPLTDGVTSAPAAEKPPAEQTAATPATADDKTKLN